MRVDNNKKNFFEKKTPESYAECFIRLHRDRIKNASLEAILEEFCVFIRPTPGRYTYKPFQYRYEFLKQYSESVNRFELIITLESFTLFITHCNSFAVNWVFYAHEKGLN